MEENKTIQTLKILPKFTHSEKTRKNNSKTEENPYENEILIHMLSISA